MSVPTGLYAIKNVRSSTVLDLDNGKSANGTKVQGWAQLPSGNQYLYDQLWYIVPIPAHNSYTLFNVKSGTVLEITDGNPADGTQAECSARIDFHNPAHLRQEWDLSLLVTADNYRLVNRATNTALDLSNGSSADGTKVQGWAIQPGNKNQEWILQRHTSP